MSRTPRGSRGYRRVAINQNPWKALRRVTPKPRAAGAASKGIGDREHPGYLQHPLFTSTGNGKGTDEAR